MNISIEEGKDLKFIDDRIRRKKENRKLVVAANRRHNPFPTKCRRIELGDYILWYGVTDTLKKDILSYDKDAEIWFSPMRQQWALYRVSQRFYSGADVLVKEHELQKPPGDWLVNAMRKYDIWKNPQLNILDTITQQEQQRELLVDKEIEEVHREVRHAFNMIEKGRQSIIVPGEFYAERRSQKQNTHVSG